MAGVLGLDTSNYTTSAAWFDGTQGDNVGKLLEVPQGALGLRQSEALFQHVKRLPEILSALKETGLPDRLTAIGASTRPREVEGSYMPCFLAGSSQGQGMAQVLSLPFYPCSHQQGHIAAAAWSAGRMDLLDRPHLVWHLSGGTTELLYVQPEGVSVQGKRLGLAFPAGKAVDSLSLQAQKKESFPVKVKERHFSLSGIENKMNALAEQGRAPEEICWYVLQCIIRAVETATKQALAQYPGLPVLCAGGVASNALLRETMTRACQAIFAPPRFSTDNAMGVAVLTWRRQQEEENHD